MCKKATSMVANLMKVERPTLVSLMEAEHVPADTQTSTLAAYDAAEAALATWEAGSASETVIELLNAALSELTALQSLLPPGSLGLLGVIIAGVEAIVGIVSANSTTNEADQAEKVDAAVAKVQLTVPDFKLSWVDKVKAAAGDDHVAANHYKHAWNEAVSKADEKYAVLKIA